MNKELLFSVIKNDKVHSSLDIEVASNTLKLNFNEVAVRVRLIKNTLSGLEFNEDTVLIKIPDTQSVAVSSLTSEVEKLDYDFDAFEVMVLPQVNYPTNIPVGMEIPINKGID